MKFEIQEINKSYVNNYQKKFHLKKHELISQFNFEKFGKELEKDSMNNTLGFDIENE